MNDKTACRLRFELNHAEETMIDHGWNPFDDFVTHQTLSEGPEAVLKETCEQLRLELTHGDIIAARLLLEFILERFCVSGDHVFDTLVDYGKNEVFKHSPTINIKVSETDDAIAIEKKLSSFLQYLSVFCANLDGLHKSSI